MSRDSMGLSADGVICQAFNSSREDIAENSQAPECIN